MNVVWSPLALEKLGDAADFIALDNPVAAEKWVNEVLDKTALLSSQPEMGRAVPELLYSNYREIIFGHYRIIYCVDHEVRVLTVRNCRQMLGDWDV